MHTPRALRLLVVSLLALAAVSCSNDGNDAASNAPVKTLSNDLENRKIEMDHEISEGVAIRFTYTTDVLPENWHITDSKTLNLRAQLVKGDDAVVLIENMHADVNLQSTKQALDGIPQDSMDDRLHVGTQPGFLVTKTFPYEETFSIEGFSETLINGWGFAISGNGASDISEERLTEKNLLKNGVFANLFTIVWDVLILDPDTGLYYKRVFTDTLSVPVAQAKSNPDVEAPQE